MDIKKFFRFRIIFWTQSMIQDGDFSKILNYFQALNIFAKSLSLDIWLRLEYVCENDYSTEYMSTAASDPSSGIALMSFSLFFSGSLTIL